MSEKEKDPEKGMADAAKGIDTETIGRELDRLNKQDERTHAEEVKRSVLEKEYAKRPLRERLPTNIKIIVGMEIAEGGCLPPGILQCPRCTGTGQYFAKKCPDCQGSGRFNVDKDGEVTILPIDVGFPEAGRKGGGVCFEATKPTNTAEGDEESPALEALGRKSGGNNPKTAKAAERGATVEGHVGANKAMYYRIPLKAGEELSFTVYTRIASGTDTLTGTFAITDEEGGILEKASFIISASGEDFEREVVDFVAQEDGMHLFRLRVEGSEADDVSVHYRIKLK